MIKTISIIGGHGRKGEPDIEKRIDLKMGDVVSIVGPTGSGKTTLINDLELFADGSTPTGRVVLINDEKPLLEYRMDPSHNPIALITQHTTFLSDLPVRTFLQTHISIRTSNRSDSVALIEETLDFANQLTGEAINLESRMTELSGGQTRALLIADAVIVCNTPIVLLDEVENAGIHRTRALELLRRYKKIFIFVTHDPRIALLSDYRIIMAQGRVTGVLHTSGIERALGAQVGKLDEILSKIREKLRLGNQMTGTELEGLV
jgi:ABC-type lipoprotein export system ATPase subunit